jgi:hypothetical protein
VISEIPITPALVLRALENSALGTNGRVVFG